MVTSLTIDKLAKIHGLSIRSINVCKNNQLGYLNDLIKHYEKHQTFQNLHNCGEKSNAELTKICKLYETSRPTIVYIEDNPTSITESWDPLKVDILIRYTRSAFYCLSVRAQNGLMAIIPDDINFSWLQDLPDLDFSNVKNIGSKTETELIQFKNDILAFKDRIIQLSGNNLRQTYLVILIRSAFPQLIEDAEFDPTHYISSDGKIRIFTLVDHLLRKGNLSPAGKSSLFLDLFTGTSVPTLAQSAQKYELSRERIRQLRMTFQEEFEEYFSFLNTFEIEDLSNLPFQTDLPVFIISHKWLTLINEAQRVNFSAQFYAQILSIVFRQQYRLIEQSVHLSYKQACYALIDRNLVESFNFVSFLADVESKLRERIVEAYELHFEGYLIGFFEVYPQLDFLKIVKKVCSDLLLEFFDLVVGYNGFLTFDQNAKKFMHEYIVEALSALGDLSHLEIIVDKLRELFPELEWNEGSIRGTMLREKDLFICIGRTSTYGLRRWEEERDNLRGGSIREMVEQYLDSEEEPKHVSEVLEYVNQYRDTTENSLVTNLEADENCRFRVFPGEFIGLNNKIYKILPSYKRLNGVHFTGIQLRKMDNWPFEAVVDYYVNTYAYLPIQVAHVLKKRIATGNITLTRENRLLI